MPRTPPELTLISIPEIEKSDRPLSQKHDWAGLLGFSKLRDDVAEELALYIKRAMASAGLVEGLTPRKRAATLKRCAKKLRWEQVSGRPNLDVRRLLADQGCGWDLDTWLLLAPLAGGPVAILLPAVERRERELEQMPRTSPQREAMESAGGVAVLLFLKNAGDNVRDEPGAWWAFTLAFLDAAGFPTEKLYQHPESLRPLLDKLRTGWRPLLQQPEVS
jgi:hypothetical protein